MMTIFIRARDPNRYKRWRDEIFAQSGEKEIGNPKKKNIFGKYFSH